jgi:hypothetical protein
MTGYLVAAFRVPTRRACGVVQCNRATFYYRSQRRDVTPLRMRLRELAAAPIDDRVIVRVLYPRANHKEGS